MSYPFDIFRLEPLGVKWVDCAPTLEEAEKRIRDLAANVSGKYLLLNQRTGNKLMFNLDGPQQNSDR
jgi:hypothetical protein